MSSSGRLPRWPGRDELDEAAARLWQAVRGRHPELPVTAPAINATYPAEPFPRTAEAVAASVLREAARALAEQRGIEVVRRGGRYHTKKFAAIAAEVGLTAEAEVLRSLKNTRGFDRISLTEDVKTLYRKEIRDIQAVLEAHPVPEHAPAPASGRSTASGAKLLAECGCPRKIYAAASTLAGPDIVCTDCGQPFRHHPPAADRHP
uniref:hypothetical protein n=1 Tax=Amycolatopsis sp. CA-151526 TaxID=3239921 RepID=UPI003F49AF5E